jgi:hypothetical protein
MVFELYAGYENKQTKTVHTLRILDTCHAENWKKAREEFKSAGIWGINTMIARDENGRIIERHLVKLN